MSRVPSRAEICALLAKHGFLTGAKIAELLGVYEGMQRGRNEMHKKLARLHKQGWVQKGPMAWRDNGTGGKGEVITWGPVEKEPPNPAEAMEWRRRVVTKPAPMHDPELLEAIRNRPALDRVWVESLARRQAAERLAAGVKR